MTHRDDQTMILFVGDSVVSTGIRPAFLPFPAYNLGRSSLLPRDLPELSRHLEGLRLRPSSIYLCITPESFFHGSAIAADGFLGGLPLAWQAYYQAPNLMGEAWLPGRSSARLSVLQDIWAASLSHRSFWIEAGGARITSPLSSNPPLALFEPDPGTRQPAFQNRNRQHLADFKAHWEAQGIPAYWIAMPLDPGRQAHLMQTFPVEYQSVQRMIIEVFGKRVFVPQTPMGAEAFQDGLHLNSEGALLFTQSLVPLLATGPQINL